MAPTIMGGSRSSGITLPCLMKDLVTLVLVEYAIRPVPMAIPTMKAVNGKDPTPEFQPRSSWNEIGYYVNQSSDNSPSCIYSRQQTKGR